MLGYYSFLYKLTPYVQLPSDPLMDTFSKVVRLLNDLRSKQHIRQWQLTKMMPDQKKIKLAHLYFIPKPHKVNLQGSKTFVFQRSFDPRLGRHTTAAHRCIHSCANHGHFENARSVDSTLVRRTRCSNDHHRWCSSDSASREVHPTGSSETDGRICARSTSKTCTQCCHRRNQSAL